MSELEDVLQQVADALLDHQNRLEALEAAAAKNPRFKRPTQRQLWDYAREIKFVELDPDAWFAHYDSNGWMVGKTPMKDWRAAVRTWQRSEKKRQRERGK